MIAELQNFQVLLEKNLEIKIQETKLKSAESKMGSMKAMFYPRTYLFAGLENDKEKKENKTGTGSGVGFNLNLFSGFKDMYETKLSNAHYEVESTEHKIILRNLLLRSRELYYDLLKVNEIEKILNEEIVFNQSNVDVIRKKISGGVISSKELLENTLYEIESKEQLSHVKSQQMQIQLELTQLFNDPSIQINVNPMVLNSGLGGVPGENLSSLNEFHNSLIANAANVEKNKWGFFSRFNLDLYGEYSFSKRHLGEIVNDPIVADRIIGLKLVFNLTDEKNQKTVEQQLLNIEQEKIKLQMELTQSQNNFKKNEFSIQLQQTDKAIDLISNKIKVLTELYLVTLSGFKTGTKDANILNDVTRRLFSAKKELLEQKVDKLKILDRMNL